MLSLQSAMFLRELIGNASLQIGAPDFDQAAAVAGKAKAELEAIIAAQPPPATS